MSLLIPAPFPHVLYVPKLAVAETFDSIFTLTKQEPIKSINTCYKRGILTEKSKQQEIVKINITTSCQDKMLFA